MKKIILLAFLLPNFALALESTLSSESACTEWKSHVTSWFQHQNVKLVGDDKEVIISCTKGEKDRNWKGGIAYRLTKERAQKISAIQRNLECATPGTTGVTRGVASVTSALLDTPCKIAGNDIKLFREEIVTEKPMPVSGGYMCCGGQIGNRWVSCSAGAMFDRSCKISCHPCLTIQAGPSWKN